MTKTLLNIFLSLLFLNSSGQIVDSVTKEINWRYADSLSRMEARSFKLSSSPIDTTYYKNGKIQTIHYRGHDEVVFFENGQTKYLSVNGSTRTWYPNGQLEYESVLINNHHRDETFWYSNGQMKAKGSLHWGDNSKTKRGDWFKNKDWSYWKKNGKPSTKS